MPKKAFICINTWCLCQALDAMSGPLMLSVASFQRHNVVCELERRLKVRQSQMRPHIVRSFTEYKMGLADVKKSIPYLVVVMVDISSLKKVDIVASLARPRITTLPVTMALTSTTRSVTSLSCMYGIGRWKRRGQNASECSHSQTEK